MELMTKNSKTLSSAALPKGLFVALRRQPQAIRVAPILIETSLLPPDAVYDRLATRTTGLMVEEAAIRLVEHGRNVVAADGRKSVWLLLWHAASIRSCCCWPSCLRSRWHGRFAIRHCHVADDRAWCQHQADPRSQSGQRGGKAEGHDFRDRCRPSRWPTSRIASLGARPGRSS